MGKIFDALQKSTREPETAGVHEESFIEKKETMPSRKDATFDAPSQAKIPPQIDDDALQRPLPQNDDRETRQLGVEAPGKAVELLPLNRLDKSLITVHEPHTYEAEQFRMLRTNLLFPKTGRPAPRTLLVTSALPGEGKSFVSANLAATIAQNVDHHVLLIDADMRHPTLHKLFGLSNADGLSDYLDSGRPIPELLQRAHSQRLTVLPGGSPPANPAELLSSRRMAALLREVRDRYNDRYIIIDSPPPHLTAESNALAQFVDGIIVVVNFNTTPRDLVTSLISRFEEGKVTGIVANWMDRGTQIYYGSEKYTKHYIGKKASGK